MAAGLFYVYTDPGTVDEAEFHDWYDHEHGPARLSVPGPGEPGAPAFLSVPELAGPEVLEDPGFLAAISTPWRDRVVASALQRERRVFGLRNAIEA